MARNCARLSRRRTWILKSGSKTASSSTSCFRRRWLTGASRRASLTAPDLGCADADSCLAKAKTNLDAARGNRCSVYERSYLESLAGLQFQQQREFRVIPIVRNPALVQTPQKLEFEPLGGNMKCVVSLPPESLSALRNEKQTGPGYQVVAVQLKDGRRFDQVVASEGCIIAVRGHNELPFRTEEVSDVLVNHKHWNFKKWSDARRPRVKAAAATA